MKPLFFLLLVLFYLIISSTLYGQIITTVAGGGTGGIGDGGLATAATIGITGGIAFDSHNNLYIADGNNNRIRKVNSVTGIITTVAGNGIPGFSGDNQLAVNAELNNPFFIAIDSSNNLYISDVSNNRIRKVDGLSGIITTIAGNGDTAFSGDNGIAINAGIIPEGLALDRYKNLYVADEAHSRLRKINAAGVITIVAGNGTGGFNGDGRADTTELNGLYFICTDTVGNVYIADWTNRRIRRLIVSLGIITTIAGGNGIGLYNGDNIPAISAEVNPMGVAMDKFGNLFISDFSNQRVREIDNNGIIHTVAGNGNTGFSGDNGLADSAEFHNVEGVAFDTCSNLYMGDSQNKRIRKIAFNPLCKPTNINMIANHLSYIVIYPNPSCNTITIESSNKIGKIAIIGTLGQTLYSKEYDADKVQIDISDFAKGVYFLQLNTNGNNEVRKIIKE